VLLILHLPNTMSKRKASAVSSDLSPELSITDIYDLLPRIGVSLLQ